MASEKTMLVTYRRPLGLLLTPLVLLAFGRPVHAEDAPPRKAPPYTAVYKSTTSGKVEPTDQKWDFTNEDTVTIAVSGDNARWENKSDGAVIIYDYKARTMTEIGGKRVPDGTAKRLHLKLAPIRWEFGHDVPAIATEGKPKILGKDTVAGTSCTRLTYDSVQYGTPEYCITKEGIPLRFMNSSDNAETKFEAVSVTPGAPDPKSFTVPSGLTIEERRQ